MFLLLKISLPVSVAVFYDFSLGVCLFLRASVFPYVFSFFLSVSLWISVSLAVCLPPSLSVVLCLSLSLPPLLYLLVSVSVLSFFLCLSLLFVFVYVPSLSILPPLVQLLAAREGGEGNLTRIR